MTAVLRGLFEQKINDIEICLAFHCCVRGRVCVCVCKSIKSIVNIFQHATAATKWQKRKKKKQQNKTKALQIFDIFSLWRLNSVGAACSYLCQAQRISSYSYLFIYF